MHESGGGGGSSTSFVGGAGAAGFPSYGGYQDFAKTGGFSPEDIANMRARGAGGVRSAYAGAQREVGRQRAFKEDIHLMLRLYRQRWLVSRVRLHLMLCRM